MNLKYYIRILIPLIFATIYTFPHAEAKLSSPAPIILTESSLEKPLSFSPVLHWKNDIKFVACELEVFTELPPDLNSKKSCKAAVFRTKDVYLSYYNLPISSLLPDKAANDTAASIWWRIRFLDRNKKPISPFCKPNQLFISKSIPPMDTPVPLAPIDNKNNMQLLYPVYMWISPFATDTYEVELYDTFPADNIKPVWKGKSTYSECYDDFPRLQKKPFYWRVRAFDVNGKQKGNWSDFVSFSNFPHHVRVAVFGDSISHGGGNLSWGPNTAELSWLTSLNFPAANLSQSGNLTKDMVDRFENDVLPFSPDILLIMGGTNDIRNANVPVEDTIRHLSIIKEKCLKNYIRPIFLTLPPIYPKNIKLTFNETTCNNWKIKLEKCNSFIRSMPEFIDVNRAFLPYTVHDHLKNEYALDGLHPDVNGKKIIADTVNDYWKRKHIQ